MKRKNYQMTYAAEYEAGRLAEDGALCPYPAWHLGKRCAWFGGYNDARREGFA